MARRQSELLELRVFECLDESEKFLVFHRAKNTKGLFCISGEIFNNLKSQYIAENIGKIYE